MNHIVLARKWRPKKFADLVGQQSSVTILQNIIQTGRIHHAYLLTGTRGVGKTTIARIIAKALNCLKLATNEPCGNCENCLQIDRGRFIDVIEIDAASNTGVDNIREVLENSQYAPTSGKYKIYIIDEVHMLSKSAFNAMLKTLEEPPAHVVFILATTDPHKVPITILSRCLQLKLRNLAAMEIEQHLALVLGHEQVGFENAALEALANAAAGSMRDALSLTDQAIAFADGKITLAIIQQMLGISDDGSIIAILSAVSQSDSEELVKICQRLNSEGANLENILQQLNYTLFQISLTQLTPNPTATSEILELARAISLQDCQLYFEITNLGIEQIAKVSNKYPIFVMTLLRMIAFTIGSSQEKQILVSSNNCKSKLVQLDSVQVEPENAHPTVDKIAAKTAQGAANPPKADAAISIAKTKSAELGTKALTPPWEEELTQNQIEPISQAKQKATELSTDEALEKSNLLAAEEYDDDASAATIPSSIEPAKFNGNWLEFVQACDFNQIKDSSVAIILRNSQLASMRNEELNLVINSSFQQLVTPLAVDSIEQLLAEHYQLHFDLSFNFSAETEASLKNHEIRESEQKQALAEKSIQNDPIIQDLLKNFSAKILPNTIKPL